MITQFLIANRGEVAVRLARAAADAGIRCVAVYAEDDADGLHCRRADQAVALDGSGPSAYMDAAQLIRVALAAGCTAVHPGWGFLSEDAGFARSCGAAGLTFIGPDPDTLAVFGDKAAARKLARSCDVPVARGTGVCRSPEDARDFLASLGTGRGVMIKAVAGGGGRGMRAVDRLEDLAQAFERCASEALRAFGHGEVYLEERLVGARHIEIQVVGDGTGECSHLHERECSVQRQRQKLIEQAPSPNLKAALRTDLIAAALTMARRVRLRSLCTFEFLVASDADVLAGASPFVFMEANPRLQVEHTVTEAVLGIDLVRAQLGVANGHSLSDLGLEQSAIPEPRGFAIEMRINAEALQPDGSAHPVTGEVRVFEPPMGSGVRVDTCAYTGWPIQARYDSMLAKVIVHTAGRDFPAAVRRACRALRECRIDGVVTNLGLLQRILQRSEFAAGTVDVDFVATHITELLDRAAGHSSADQQVHVPPSQGGRAGTAPTAFPEGVEPVRAVSPGRLVSIAAAGDRVVAGDTLAVVEAMKMEHAVTASADGVVAEVHAATGSSVQRRDLLLTLVRSADAGRGTRALEAPSPADADSAALDAVARARADLLDAARPGAVAKQQARGEMTARERLTRLCDAGSFREFGGLVREPSLDREAPADGLISGSARIAGRPVIAVSQDFTVFGGSSGELGSRKLERAAALAMSQGLPLVMLLDGGGHRIQLGQDSRAFANTTPLFHDLMRMSGWVPMVAAVMGAGFAANTNYSAVADFVTMVRGQAAMGIAGPALVKAGTGETVSIEDLGGASAQVDRYGLADHGAANESEALDMLKTFLSYLPSNARQPAPRSTDWQAPEGERLRHIVPSNSRRAYDMHEVIRHLVDTGSVFEPKRTFAGNLITALARIDGRPVGIVANQPLVLGGMLDAPACEKGARFIAQCDAFGLPLIHLIDVPGFSIGSQAEQTMLGRRSAKLLFELGHATVPRISVVLRKGYGLGFYAMNGGRTFDADAALAWPTAEICAMSVEGSVDVAYRRDYLAAEDPGTRRLAIIDEMRRRIGPLQAASGFGIDDVIDPRDTRERIVEVLDRAPARRQNPMPPKFRAIAPI